MKYPNASTGIRRIYIAEILSVLAAVLAIVVMILTAANHIDLIGEEATRALQAAKMDTPFVVLSLSMMLLMLVSFFMNLSGIIKASKDEIGFKNAL